MVNTAVTLCGTTLENPVIAASGSFGYGREFSMFYDLNCLGSLSFKGTTLQPRFGNPQPRIAECECGMLISIGLQNPGVEGVMKDELPLLKYLYHKKVLANIAGFCIEDYTEAVQRLNGEEQIGWFELNVSCPNVDGGAALGEDPKAAEAVTRAVKGVAKKPVIVKLSPNVRDITEIAKACESGGADGLSLINAPHGMKIDLKTKKPVLARKSGGYCGPGIKPIALKMVYDCFEAVKLPLVGIGGVQTAEDVLEYLLAGATAVGVGAANLTEPFTCKNIIEALPEVMQKYGITSLSSIIGAAH